MRPSTPNQSNSLKKLLSFKKFLAINFITILSWQSIAYGAGIGVSLIYTYIIAIILFHIPNLVLTKHLLKDKNNHGNYNLIYLVNNKLNYFSNCLLTFCTWFSNVVGYPAGFAFILSNLAYAFNYNLSKTEYFSYVVLLYLIMSFINMRGFKFSFKIMLIFSLFGVFAPMAVITLYAIKYSVLHPALITSWLIDVQLSHPFKLADINFGFILAIIMTIIGYEQTSLHFDEISSLKFKRYHLVIASIAIIFFTFFMMLVLSYVTTTHKIDPNYLISGTIIEFFKLIHHPILAKPFIILFNIGEFGCAFAWMVHINRTFNATLLLAKSPKIRAWGSNYTPKKIIKFELLIFLLYYILLQIFTALQTSQILFNLSVQLSIAYYVILYLAIIKDSRIKFGSRIVLFIGLIASIAAVICSFIPNVIL